MEFGFFHTPLSPKQPKPKRSQMNYNSVWRPLKPQMKDLAKRLSNNSCLSFMHVALDLVFDHVLMCIPCFYQ